MSSSELQQDSLEASNTPIEVSSSLTTLEGSDNNYELEYTDNTYILAKSSGYGDSGIDSGSATLPNWLNKVITDRILEGTATFQDVINDMSDVIRQLGDGVNSQISAMRTDNETKFSQIDTNVSRLNGNTAAAISQLTTDVTNNYAKSTDLNVLQSEYNDTKATLISLDATYASDKDAYATHFTGVDSAINDQSTGLAITSSAVSTLNTKVGIKDGVVDGTGLMQSVAMLQKQGDGVIETTIGVDPVMVFELDSNGDIKPDTLDLVNDADPYASWLPIESTIAPVDNGELPGRVYKYTDANGDISYYEKDVNGWVALDGIDEYTAKLEALRAMHIGDVYIRYHVDSVTNEKVYDNAYKFIKTIVDDTSPYGTDTLGYTWSTITDTDSQNAFVVALQAKDLADGKRRIFVDKPAADGVYDTDVDIGDMWLVASDYVPADFAVGDILRAKNNKVVGNTYSDNDWIVASRYTDFISAITQANELLANQRDGTITSWKQTTNPRTGTNTWSNGGTDADHAGDLWINDNGAEGTKVAIFDGSVWTYPSIEVGKELYNQFKNLDIDAYEDGKASVYSGTYSKVVTDIDTDLAALRSALEGNDPLSVADVTFRGQASTPSQYGSKWSLSNRKNNTGNVWYISYTLHTDATTEKVDSDGDVITPSIPAHDEDVTIGFRWSGESWNELKDGIAFGNAEALTKLKVDLGDVAANSTLSQTITAVDDKIDTNFQYDTNTTIDGKLYNSGFGLKTTTHGSSDGGVTDPYDSEFWVKASTFRFVEDTTQLQAFTISGNSIHFNGNMSVYGITDNSQNPVNVGVRLADSTSDPVSAHIGDTYYNTSDGVVYSYTSAGWISTEGKQGNTGISVNVQFASTNSTNDSDWHETPTNTDKYMRTGTKAHEETNYTYKPGVKIKGEPGGSAWVKWNGTKLLTKVSVTSPGPGWIQDDSNGVDLKGEPGISVSSINRDSNGQVTVTYSDATTDTFTIDDGSSITVSSVSHSGTSTTVHMSDGSSFNVEDGLNGTGIASIASSKSGITTTVTVTKDDGTSESFTISDGGDGSRGSGWYHTTTGTAINAYPSGDAPVAGDIVIVYSDDPVNAKAYTRNSNNNGWDVAASFIHGNMVVDGTITGEKVRTGLITSTDGTSMKIDLDAGSIYIA